MNDKYYQFRNEKEMEIIINNVEKQGYHIVGDKKATFKEVKENFKRNKIYLVNCFYNTITKNLEYQFTTSQILKTYGTTNIKCSNFI